MPKKKPKKIVKEVKDVKKDIKDTKITPYDPLKKKVALLDVKSRYKKLKARFKPEDTYLINMELRNGMHDFFFINSNKSNYVYKGGTYIIDDEAKYYVLSANRFALDYHQDLSVPIKRKIPFNEVRKAIVALESSEVETAINPSSLKHFIESEVIQKVMKGQELDAMLKKILIVCGIGALAGVIHLMVFVFKSGMLNSIHVPGFG